MQLLFMLHYSLFTTEKRRNSGDRRIIKLALDKRAAELVCLITIKSLTECVQGPARIFLRRAERSPRTQVRNFSRGDVTSLPPSVNKRQPGNGRSQ